MPEIRSLRPEDLPRAVAVLTAGLGDDAAVTWPTGDRHDPEIGVATFGSLARASASRGWLWGIDDVDGVASWVPPDADAYDTFLEETDRELRPIVGAWIDRYERFWAFVEDARPAEPHWYLDFLAVDGTARGRGLGVALVNEGLTWAARDGVPAFLMTTVERNVGFYERRGFRVDRSGPAPDGGPPMWFLRSDPAPGSVPRALTVRGCSPSGAAAWRRSR